MLLFSIVVVASIAASRNLNLSIYLSIYLSAKSRPRVSLSFYLSKFGPATSAPRPSAPQRKTWLIVTSLIVNVCCRSLDKPACHAARQHQWWPFDGLAGSPGEARLQLTAAHILDAT